MDNYFIFGGVDVRDFGALVVWSNIDRFPRRSYQTVTVPGRNGLVYVDQRRFETVRMSYHILFAEEAHRRIVHLQDALLSNPGMHRLEDTYRPNEFYSAICIGGDEPELSPERDLLRMTINFERRPERWLKLGEMEHDVDGELYLANPTNMAAKPLLRVTGNGSCTLAATGTVVSVTGNSGTVLIDCDAEDCWTEDGENANGIVSFYVDGEDSKTFPTLPPGQNPILQGTVAGLKIIPRWWRL